MKNDHNDKIEALSTYKYFELEHSGKNSEHYV